MAVKVFEVEELVTGTLDSRCIKIGDGTLTVFVDVLGDQAHAITADDTMKSFIITSLQRQAPKYGDSMFCTTRDTTIGEPDEDVDATEGSITMDTTCTVDGGSASAAASAGARPAEHGLAGRKVTVRDLKAYYETHDQAKATDANCKKLLSSYTDDEIFKALERKYKSPLMRAIDLDDF